tara:strand:+ start:288 stop:1916 length:1629 start_codon:yes stop_codon:yes gene_type:complete
MAVDKMVEEIDRKYERLLSQRSNWDSHFQELGDYLLPRKADITKKRMQGAKRTDRIFDSTGIHAVELLAAHLQSMLTNVSMSWFTMGFRDTELAVDNEANRWLQDCTKLLDKAIDRSNFSLEIHELYFDLVVFGTGCLFIEYKEDGLHYSARHISELAISSNDKSQIDTVYRCFKLTARQIAQKFPDVALPDRVKKDLEHEPYNEHEIVHAVYPMTDMKKSVFNKPIMSCYYHKDSKTLLGRGGYDEFPFCVPRFNLDSTSSMGFGRSPAMTCLADVKMVNKMSEVSIKSAQKQLDPPLMCPDDGFFSPIRVTPGAINFYRAGTRDRLEPLQAGTNNPIALNMEEQRRQAIRNAFYIDQLQMQESPQMTATEILARQEQSLRSLGSVLGRLQHELLQPLIQRSFKLMLRNGEFGVPPEKLQGQNIDIEYVSPLAKAQKGMDLQSTMRGMEIVGGLSEAFPAIRDFIDEKGLAEYIVEYAGLPAKIVRSDEEVEAMRQERAEQAAQQQQQQEEMMAAEKAQKAAPLLKVMNEAGANVEDVPAA